MRHEIRVLLLLTFLVLVLTACAPCTIEEFKKMRPLQTDPTNHSLVADLRPVLRWNARCTSDEYILKLSVNATDGTVTDTGIGGTTGSSAKEWSPSVDLTPGTAYIWRVAGLDLEGPFTSQYSQDWWEFIVGPACEAASLIAPVPVEPIGDNISTLEPPYIWEYTDPTCTPGGYALQVSTDPDFTGLVINMRENNPIKAWFPSVALNDCGRYYWRVAAIDGLNDGPWSVVSNFKINVNQSCPKITAEVVGDISEIPPLAPFCGDGKVDEGEQCDGDDLSMCLSGQVCENCQCITYVEAEPIAKLCVYEALQNTNCRKSDYAESDLIAILMEGETTELVALNPEYTHGLFDLEGRERCWIWLGLMGGPENPFGTCDVEIIDPLEAPRDVTCQPDLDEENCSAAGGRWVVGARPICMCPEE
jgi:hypothetical protein